MKPTMDEFIRQVTGGSSSGDIKITCPLPGHHDKTPSFCIHGTKGMWKCYGCNERGNSWQLAKILGIPAPDDRTYTPKYEGKRQKRIFHYKKNGKRKDK